MYCTCICKSKIHNKENTFFVQKEWKYFINIFMLFASSSCSAKLCGWVNCWNEEKQNKTKYDLVLLCCAPYEIMYFQCMSFMAHRLQLAQPGAKKKKKNRRVLNYKPKTLAITARLFSFSLFYNSHSYSKLTALF